jgi:hypothetical protein
VRAASSVAKYLDDDQLAELCDRVVLVRDLDGLETVAGSVLRAA